MGKTDDNFGLLRTKNIIAILDGDTIFGEFAIETSNQSNRKWHSCE